MGKYQDCDGIFERKFIYIFRPNQEYWQQMQL
jgi:hypothetical protein